MDDNHQVDSVKTLLLVTNDRMGHGDDVLGEKLMTNYINNLKEMGSDLWRIVLLNSGVRLSVEGSEALPALRDLEKDGLNILVCTTCLNHFDLLEQKQVGSVTNMPDIVNAMQFADKVITL
jgi:selenium metabolism protein YedF